MSAGTSSSMLNRLRSLQVGSQLLAPMGGVQQAGVQQSDPTDLSPDEKLDVFAQVVDEVAAQQVPAHPAPISAIGTSKEYLAASTPDTTSVDAGSHTGVEYEPTPEISPEVESFMQHVEEHEDQLPQEVVVAGDDIQLQTAHYAAQPVVVLPYDKETEKEAVFKGPRWSVRWLLEFGHKIIKMFGGKVIYLQSESETKQ